MRIKLYLIALVLAFGFTAHAQVSENENAAKNWIKDHTAELKIKDFHTFKLNFVKKSLSGETLRFQQTVNNTPVFESEIVVHFSPQKEVTHVSDSYDANVQNIDTKPSLSAESAIAIANGALNVTGKIYEQQCKLFVYNKLEATKLVYRVVTASELKSGDWETIVDAKTGAVLSIKDIAFYHHDKGHKHENENKDKISQAKTTEAAAFVSGTAMIFNPDPLSVNQVAYGGNYVDNSDATNAQLDASRSSVVLREIDFTGGVYKLKSRYVEIKDVEAPSKGLFTQATPNFIFNRNQDGFEAVNAFYHLDKSLEYINETLGIDCVPYQHGGILWYDPSAFNGADNSSYGAGTLKFGEGGVDDAEDADVILHELGHGLHDWMTNGSLSQVNGLSEGSGDYWAMSYSRSLNQWPSTAAAYHWEFSWDGHNPFFGGRNTNSSLRYPGGLNGDIYNDSAIWSTILMKIWDAIGKEKTDRMFLEGLALTNSSTNQQNAARALRQAAIDMNYSCADIKTISTIFATAGYTMPAVTPKVNCPDPLTVETDSQGNYIVPDFTSSANAINPNCDAVLVQTPAPGSVLAPGAFEVVVTSTLPAGSSTTCSFTLTVDDALGVKENAKQQIAIYPNPALNEITIKGNLDHNDAITIYNMLGQKAMEKAIDSNEQKIDVSKLPSGVYTINFNNSKISYKFVKN